MNVILSFVIGIASLSSLLFSIEDDEAAAKRVYTHLLIGDAHSAVKDARQYLALFPESKTLKLSMIHALCKSGNEIEALEEWKKISQTHEELKKDHHCLEALAWAVLSQGESSNQLVVRLNSLIGAALTHDVKAIQLLTQQLRGSNALIRSLAINLAATFGDLPLQDEIARLLKEEKIWFVRLEVIKAIGKLRMVNYRLQLKEIIANPKTLAEEKAAAIVALVSMYDSIDDLELQQLIHSNRSGLRELAAEIISHLDLKNKILLLLPLLKDSSPNVRVATLNTFGLLNVDEIEGEPLIHWIRPLMHDSSVEVAMTASWLSFLKNDQEAAKKLSEWILGDEGKTRRLASAALAICGKKGVKLSHELIKKSSDPYVKVNLALGLIGQRKHVRLSCETLFAVIKNREELWMWESAPNPLFRSLAPSQLKHIEQIPNYPSVVDQLTRLELLSVLSILRDPKAEEAVKQFLQNQTWGIAGAAAAMLLQEGGEGALDIVRSLLEDPDDKVRVQAALLLAILGSDQAAVKVLQQAYFHVERDMKVYILEALGHVGDASSISFLLDVFNEPFQVLRVVAASALIQCLYH